MKKPMISFISPCYDVNRYLDDYFKSFIPLIGNKLVNFEIIVVDDRGNEDPMLIAKKYLKKLPITFVKNPKNLGLGFSRNEGLKHLSKNSTHVVYIDSDDVLEVNDWPIDIKIGQITWFDEYIFDKVKIYKRERLKNFGKNLFNNSANGVAIPTPIAMNIKFETRSYEDLLVNRRLIKEYKDVIVLSEYAIMGYRARRSGISSSKPTPQKFRDFQKNMETLIREDCNTYRFNIQEIHQYYWMWRKYLKKDIKASQLTKTNIFYRVMFWFTGSMIRWLHIEGLVYGSNNPNSFE